MNLLYVKLFKGMSKLEAGVHDKNLVTGEPIVRVVTVNWTDSELFPTNWFQTVKAEVENQRAMEFNRKNFPFSRFNRIRRK